MDQTSETEKVYQKQKYDEIIEILLSAGYFRARINTLSEFDKVVGGLCWCITSTGEDVDVDILFQENSTIGQRISLSEAIVKALRKMRCPSNLQPHQIQGGVGGSDFPAILPVIVWLVKKFFERRDEREAQLRSFSTLQFSKNFKLPQEGEYNTITTDLAAIIERNKANRLFKRKELKNESEETRVRSCLLEYGVTFGIGGGGGESETPSSKSSGKGSKGGTADKDSSSISVLQSLESGKKIIRIAMNDIQDISASGTIGANLSSIKSNNNDTSSESKDLNAFERKLAQAQIDAKKEEEKFLLESTKLENELMTQMSNLTAEDGSSVSGSNVGAIVNLGSSEIGNVVAQYKLELEENKKNLDSNIAVGGKLGQSVAIKRQLQNIQSQRENLVIKLATIDGVNEVMLEKLNSLEQEKDNAALYNSKLQNQIEKLGELEKGSSQQDEIAKLKNLIYLNESYKQQENTFKAQCKIQMEELNEMIKNVSSGDGAGEDEEEERKLREIEDMHGKVFAKYNHLRQLLAQTNLDIAHNIRVIDDVPTRTELIQYERRFVELYQQVAYKLDETKKYYSMYNILDTTLSYGQKEAKLLNSISSSFDDAMKHPQSKIEFLDQFAMIVKGVSDALKQQETLMKQNEKQVEELKNTHQNLVDEQRKYFKAVKDFQDECTKNEWLTAKLEQMQHQ